MEIDDLTLLVSVEDQIRAVLDTPALDIYETFQAGNLKVLRDCVLHDGRVEYVGPVLGGTRSLLDVTVQGRAFIVATTSQFDYVHRQYAASTAYIREHQETLRPLDLVAELRSAGKAAPKSTEGQVQRYGRTLVPRPYMGTAVLMEPDTSNNLHWMVVDDTFQAQLGPDVDAVLELGCGTGHALLKLALNCDRDIPFFGGEIARHGRACLEDLARISGCANISAVACDIRNPDFSFLRGHRRLLLLTHMSLGYGENGLRKMWDALFATVPFVRACLFEPLSYAITDLPGEPMFSQDQARRYCFDLEVYPELLRKAAAGEIAFDELVPDISGINMLTPVTLVRFHTLAN